MNNASEPFEFVPLFTSGSPAPNAIDAIPDLERDFCSNFSCCGLSLGNLHELIDHFEEAHVVVFDATGNPIYPLPARPHDLHPHSHTGLPRINAGPPFAPHASLVLDYPQPSAVASEASELESPVTDADAWPYSFIQSMSSDGPEQVETCSSGSHSSELTCLPPSSFTACPEDVRDHKQEKSVRWSSELLHRTEKKRTHGHAYSKRREKMFQCPRQGCTKRYLNPNGLKYHLEKGTCKIDLYVEDSAS